MSAKAEEYRVKAADCDKQAAAASDPDIKAQFREFARLWRQVAEAAEAPSAKKFLREKHGTRFTPDPDTW